VGNKDNLDTISTGSNTTTSMSTTTSNENNTAFDAPVTDAVCFNQHYPVPSLSPRQQHRLYRDYSMAFDLIRLNNNSDTLVTCTLILTIIITITVVVVRLS
jgi:hypothetical protein